MNVVIRTDASLQIGSGHVMRCVTLADCLRSGGASCRFICRNLPGNLIPFIKDQGFDVISLEGDDRGNLAVEYDTSETRLTHADWLGTRWNIDASQTRAALNSTRADWLVVDHYALDHSWELALRTHCDRIMVIDDLADRKHDCDLLLDQNFGRVANDYQGLLPANCFLMIGPEFALLRPEFAELRGYSLQRRRQPKLRNLLVTMGGIDSKNITGQVLEKIKHCRLPADCHITVVLGMHAPWITQVQNLARELPWPCEVKAQVSDMAKLMADSDLAIGAAGSTSWERCALGLPSFILVLAENQRAVAENLDRADAARLISLTDADTSLEATIADTSESVLSKLALNAASLTEGNGTEKVVQVIYERTKS